MITHRVSAGCALFIVLFSACSGTSASGLGNNSGNGDAGAGGGDAGSTSKSDSGITPTADATKACGDAANAFCTQLQTCSPFGLQAEFGDVGTCESRFALGCVQTFSFPGTSATPATTEACANAIPAVSCADFVAENFGDACATQPGTLVNGSVCGDNAQCASTFCARAPDSQCGTCSALSTAGGACVNQSCSTGFACPTGQTTCVVPTAGQIGDHCTSQADCDLAHAVGCNTGDSKCLKLEIASSSSCGADSITPTKFTVCPKNGTCDSLLGGACHAAAADGTACSTSSSGPSCLSPAKCVASVCTLPDATACH